MSAHSGALGRQIIRSVVVTSISSVIVTLMGMYLFYGILIRVAPQIAFPEKASWLPSGIEWVVIIALCAVSGAMATIIASRLARGIVAPIVAVAEGARRIADGDLTARAIAEAGPTSEVSMLVDDFNLLAERLERASQAVTQWNATIAHELRTPVTILRGRLQGLADGVFQPEPALLRSLEGHATSLSVLIDDLRTVTLFDGGHLHISPMTIDLGETIAATVQFMREGLEGAGFTIDTQIERAVCEADGQRVRQALIALLENAKRHADPGRVQVTLSRQPDSIRLEVRDSGPGLAPDFATHAFDPFARYIVEGEVIKGSGLGLSVVKAIAEVHGGEASYQTIDGGACFVMTLPCKA